MAFETLELNFFNTTTQAAFDSNTLLASNLINRDFTLQYVSSGFNDDNTTTSIVISFDATTAVDRIALLEHNLKAYDIFYDGVTANTFSFTTTSSTNTSQFSSNSETAQYFRATQVNCTSVTFDLKSTIEANAEKAIGYMYIGALNLTFERTPSAKNYKPMINEKQVIHRLSDGGTRVQKIEEKYKVDIKYKNITESFRNDLRTLYRRSSGFFFAPFGTATSWDAVFFESVWEGPFDFFKYSDDAVAAGFEGTIKLRETAI